MSNVNECPECKSTSHVSMDNTIVCTGCGLILGDDIKYVSTYALRPHYRYPKKQPYVRIIRFRKFLDKLKCTEIFQNIEKILTLFGVLEMGFSTFNKRKYFWTRQMVSKFLSEFIGLSVELRGLRDKQRTKEQMIQMKNVLTNTAKQFQVKLDDYFKSPP